MKILVTGATGFLGSALAEKLLAEGCCVVGVARREYGFLSKSVFENSRFQLVQMDLTKFDEAKLSHFVFDAVVHLAADQASSPPLSWNDYVRGNIDATRSLIAYVKGNKIKQLILSSTFSVFGKPFCTDTINELTPPVPATYYGLSKFVAERIIEIELASSSTKGVIIRFPSIFGKNHLGGIVYTFHKLAKENKPIDIYSRGERYRNLLYIDDAVNVIIQCLRYSNELNPYEVFSAGSRDSRRMIEIALMIRDGINSKSEIVPVNKFPPSDWDVFIDTTKLNDVLGVKTMTIQEGINLYLGALNNEI